MIKEKEKEGKMLFFMSLPKEKYRTDIDKGNVQ